jgi:propionate catabolism operon transcriptional regulator
MRISPPPWSGDFRDDLYYRLNVFTLRLPPLRERREDIEAIASHYLDDYARQYGVSVDGDRLVSSLREALRSYPWPGNVRELQNFMERLAVNMAGGADLDSGKLRQVLPELYQPVPGERRGALREQETLAIRDAMRRHNGDKTAVSRELGISTTTLWRRLRDMQKEQASAGSGGDNDSRTRS